ncbi:MAG: signal recognition particle protein [Chloroflexi bacterium]|nr:signal recognition particle protein [Chloroflexota bacterium]MCI0834482.1 signal recognition particle protein [Chloroflexota bacterium]MCI0837009.1 signal recognition particle protein [Chloroflexota bacterium]MCI0871240.1 signal recognition particle protein [Chloroflexota bacterium]MCI0874502.1 signal recognition particle protein [Chloroflexota bacterium]
MFESLSDKLGGVFGRLTSRGKLSEKDVDAALREVRLALLEADVDFKVARQFVKTVKERAEGDKIFTSLTPGQSVVRIVREELTEILGGETAELARADRPPSVIMLVGLQGTGKTTLAAKLALSLRKEKHTVMMAACDLQRPAAVDQLNQLGKQLDIDVYSEEPSSSTPVKVATAAVKKAAGENIHYLILDTAGRLAIDDTLMGELEEIRDATSPVETLLVLDAMTGQDAVRSGGEFNSRIGLTGIVLTKMDGDARGGAALSMRSVTGVPIKYISIGERPDQFEVYHPDRIASRILGMGDVETLIEKAEIQFDSDQALDLERKIRKNQFDLNDMLQQFQTIKKMGSLTDVLGMIPGMGALRGKFNPKDLDERRMAQVEAIIYSMTAAERQDPSIINGSRRKRIADGSGSSPAQVNQLLAQFKQMQKMMKKMAGPGGKRALMGMIGRN